MPAEQLILVVDDDQSARRLVRMGLELEGAQVREASSLAEARALLDPAVRGLVLDRELPDGDGLDLLADVARCCGRAVVVVNSTRDDGLEPPGVARVPKGDLPNIVRALGLSAATAGEARLSLVDLVRSEAASLVAEWEELCRWDPALPPDSRPHGAQRVLEAIGLALQHPQPLGWGPDPALREAAEAFASTSAIDVTIGQLVCLRETFRRRIVGQVPPAEVAETQARVDMIVDRAIWSAARVAADRLQRQLLVDPVTGLGNRRAFDADLERELQRARRYQRALGVVVAGPGQGGPAEGELDELAEAQLRRLAGALATNVRSQDGVYRTGASTVALVLPETEAAGATRLLARLGPVWPPSFERGWAVFPHDGRDAVSLLLEAEARRGERSTGPPVHDGPGRE